MRKALSNGRRLTNDVVHIANRMPLVVLTQDMDLSSLAKLRRRAKPKISWNALFMKSYSIVCADNPDLRSVYVPLPWPHIYVHDANVCMLVVAREHQGETRLLWARFNQPQRQSLTQLQEALDRYQEAPVESIRQFRHQVAFARCPFFLRRLGWWVAFNVLPRHKCRNMGTFGMSLSGFGAARAGKILGPCTTTLGIDPLPRRGVSHFQLTFDHRIMDGMAARDVANDLLKVMRGPIAEELKQMAATSDACSSDSVSEVQGILALSAAAARKTAA